MRGSFLLPLIALLRHLSTVASNDKRIFGGQEVNIEKYPFYAFILRFNRTNLAYCGGSIVAPKWIMTIDHCLERTNAEAYVFVGMDEFVISRSYDERPDIVDRAYEKVEETLIDDETKIALIMLKKPLEYSSRIGQIALPSSKEESYSEFETIGSGLTEIGLTHRLKVVKMTDINTPKCVKIYEEMFGKGTWAKASSTTICAEKKHGEGPCRGDSGGPLLAKRSDGSRVIIGVTLSGNTAKGTDFHLGIHCVDAPDLVNFYARVAALEIIGPRINS